MHFRVLRQDVQLALVLELGLGPHASIVDDRQLCRTRLGYGGWCGTRLRVHRRL